MTFLFEWIELTDTHVLLPNSGHSFNDCMKVQYSHELIWVSGLLTIVILLASIGTLLMKHYRAVARGAIRKRVSRHVNNLFFGTFEEIRRINSLPFEYRSLQF